VTSAPTLGHDLPRTVGTALIESIEGARIEAAYDVLALADGDLSGLRGARVTAERIVIRIPAGGDAPPAEPAVEPWPDAAALATRPGCMSSRSRATAQGGCFERETLPISGTGGGTDVPLTDTLLGGPCPVSRLPERGKPGSASPHFSRGFGRPLIPASLRIARS